MGVKVYFVYDGEGAEDIVGERMGREAYKAKITLPDSWMAGPAEKLLTFYCSTYNKKFPETPLDPAVMYLRVGTVSVPLTGVTSAFVQEHNDILVLHRAPEVVVAAAQDGSLVCGNFGCGKRFTPEDNSETACHHHAKGPVFHDTYKFWGCCPDQKAMDWEDFEAITKCVVGPHAVASKPVSFQSPNQTITNTALSAEQAAMAAQTQQAPAAPMMDGKPRTGPREFEEGRQGDEPGPIAEDGTAKCRNYGCGKRFAVADNTANACSFHSAGPVFHDTYKYWKCCPDRKHIDFDDFAKIEGCTVGQHKR
jgi:hypothetical protein